MRPRAAILGPGSGSTACLLRCSSLLVSSARDSKQGSDRTEPRSALTGGASRSYPEEAIIVRSPRERSRDPRAVGFARAWRGGYDDAYCPSLSLVALESAATAASRRGIASRASWSESSHGGTKRVTRSDLRAEDSHRPRPMHGRCESGTHLFAEGLVSRERDAAGVARRRAAAHSSRWNAVCKPRPVEGNRTHETNRDGSLLGLADRNTRQLRR